MIAFLSALDISVLRDSSPRNNSTAFDLNLLIRGSKCIEIKSESDVSTDSITYCDGNELFGFENVIYLQGNSLIPQ